LLRLAPFAGKSFRCTLRNPKPSTVLENVTAFHTAPRRKHALIAVSSSNTLNDQMRSIAHQIATVPQGRLTELSIALSVVASSQFTPQTREGSIAVSPVTERPGKTTEAVVPIQLAVSTGIFNVVPHWNAMDGSAAFVEENLKKGSAMCFTSTTSDHTRSSMAITGKRMISAT
jgi:hypothetical protein